MLTKATIANNLYFFLNSKKFNDFKKDSTNLINIQERYLFEILQKNVTTLYGKKYKFNNIQTLQDYQSYVPLTVYEDYLPYISEIKAGKKNVLTIETIHRFSLSSGTSSASKLIPYNKSLKNEFNHAIAPWIYDIYKNIPEIRNGTAFWIVTPSGKIPEIESKIPVGFDEDSSYFGFIEKFFIRSIMVVPDWISKITDTENYYYLLSYFLLKNSDLRLISVWNPTIIPIILSKIFNNKESLIEDISKGKISLPNNCTKNEKELMTPYLKANLQRSSILRTIFSAKTRSYAEICWPKVWPCLSLISCWTDSWASDYSKEIGIYFPNVKIQSKGLLATEAVISIPMTTPTGNFPVLAYKSHFFEFLNIDSGQICLANQLEKNKKYAVIVTTGGGFYRYQLHDIIEVTGFYNELPQLKFIGKIDSVSDCVGEKLHETLVETVLKNLTTKFVFKPDLIFLAPKIGKASALYILFISDDNFIAFNENINLIIKYLDDGLRENFHYNHARNLGQLQMPEIYILNKDAKELFLQKKSEFSKPGTVKFSKLEKTANWHNILQGKTFKFD
jgi:hypothetical protein